jgi:hypothetical protein
MTLKLVSIILSTTILLANAGAQDQKIHETEEGGRVSYPSSIERALFEAYQAYPELHHLSLSFRFRASFMGSYMQAQPFFHSVFLGKNSRSYIVRMKPVMLTDQGNIALSSVPQKVVVGWLAHELGHVFDYLNRSTLGMLSFGLGYISSDRLKREAEYRADKIAIEHGFADYLLATKKFIAEHRHWPEGYQAKIARYYMSAEEVRAYAKAIEEKNNK